MITEQLVSAPLESFRLESGVQSYHTESKRMIVRAREKCIRTTADHRKRLAVQNDIPQRIVTRSSFHCKATEFLSIFPEELSNRQDVNLLPSPLWLASSFCIKKAPFTIPGMSDHNDPSALKLEKSLDHITSYQVDYTIYNDGLTSAGTRNGGL